MRYGRMAGLAFVATLVVVACSVPSRAKAQSLARRVSAAPDGKVRFTFAAREGICGYHNSIQRGPHIRHNWSDREAVDVEYDTECSSDPVRIVLEVNDGSVTKVHTNVGGRWRPAARATTDLGAISVREATDYLLGLAASADGKVSSGAIMPATLADSVTIWPALSRLARDESRPKSTRSQASFWLGQAAGDRLAGPERERDDPESEIRKQAVFALSQRRNGEAVPALIEVARRNRDPEVRRTAIFWLGQTNDPRAISLFDEILRR